MLNSIGERTEPCGTPFFSLLSLLRCPSLVCTTKLRFDNISMMKRTMCLSGMILSSFRWSPRCHTVSYAAVKSRNTTPAFSLFWKLRCLVLVVLLGPPLIYHGGSRLVPEEDVGPQQGRCGCVSTSPESWTGRRAVKWVCTTWGLAQVYLVLGGRRL